MRDFEILLRESLPENAASALVNVLGDGSSSAEVSIRLNPLKVSGSGSGSDLCSGFDLRPLPWCGDAFFLSGRPNFTLDPAFHAGAYYVQDSSSMFPALVADKILESLSAGYSGGSGGSNGAVLDLCASPGGKSTHLISLLSGSGALVVCNEAVGKRVPPLTDNIAKWGARNVIVTNTSAACIGGMAGFFDVILADVPCSGEGMFRKSADAVSGWSMASVKECAALQRSIISDVWPALREGGLLIYSTCTYNHFENQDNVAYIAEELGAEFVPVLASVEGLVSLPWGYQFVPGLVPGEGQFFAVLRKTSSATFRRKPVRKARFVSAGGEGLVQDRLNNQIYQFEHSLDFANWISEVNPGCVKSLGCRVGEIKAGKIIPDADLALSTAMIGAENGQISVNSGVCGKVSALEFSCAEIDKETALKFLSRENITPQPSWPRGYILLRYRSLGLGFVNNLGNRCNSLHPLMRRIRTYNPMQGA